MKYRFFLGVIVAAFLLRPFMVQADTANTQIIAQLQAEIAQLQAQLQVLSSASGQSWCHTFTANLGFANSGSDEVAALHAALQKENISYGSDSSNEYAAATAAAVAQFQEKYEISPQSGYVGVKTRGELNTIYGCSSATPVIASPPISSTSVGNPAVASGTLDLSESSSYSDQSIAPSQTKFKLADFTLTNNTGQPVNLASMEVDLSIANNPNTANLYLTNVFLVYDNVTTATSAQISTQNYWKISHQISSGQAIDVSVYGDINSSIPAGSVINAEILVSGTAVNSAVAVTTNGDAVLQGQNISIGTGSLTASEDVTTPAAAAVSGEESVIAGKFIITAANNAYTVSEIKFVVPNQVPQSLLESATLSGTATGAPLSVPVALTYSGGRYMFDFLNVDIPVAANASSQLTVSYLLGQVSSPDYTDIDISPVLAYLKAQDSQNNSIDGAAVNYSSNIPTVDGGIVLPPQGITVNSLRVFKSVPAFSLQPQSTQVASGSATSIYTFAVIAGKTGDVAIKQLDFSVAISDPNNDSAHLNNFSFFKGNADYSGSVIIGENVNNNYVSLLPGGSGIGTGTSTVIVTFGTEDIISAGTTVIYTLKAQENNFLVTASGSASVSTYIPSDQLPSTSGSYLRSVFLPIYGLADSQTGISINNTYNFLWSDESASIPSHSDANGYSTDDWYDGFGISSLPLSAQAVMAH